MATEIKMPQWAMTLSEGTITQWKKKEGDTVKEGDALCEIEQAKVTQDLESNTEGVLLKIIACEGETVPAMSVICIIGEAGESV